MLVAVASLDTAEHTVEDRAAGPEEQHDGVHVAVEVVDIVVDV